jgi:hypothetical protein
MKILPKCCYSPKFSRARYSSGGGFTPTRVDLGIAHELKDFEPMFSRQSASLERTDTRKTRISEIKAAAVQNFLQSKQW